MRIIKPQQLAVLKSGYQIGQQSWLGVSIVAGCWMNKPAHFTTLAQIWQAWSSAPHGYPVLDSAEPKPFAEFLLAGTLLRPATTERAQASVAVGPLERRWQVEAARDPSGKVLPFEPCPMTHGRAAQTDGNPQGSLAPRLFLQEQTDTLVAPAPVPQQFPLRQRWLSAVQTEMQSDHYREHVFPGIPAAMDARYFQLAPESQQMQVSDWPAGTPVRLRGFMSEESETHFTLPDIEARCWYQRRNAALTQFETPLKTLWLLPDSGIILLVFTGQIPLSHLLDDSIIALAAGLDTLQARRPDSHFMDVIARRSAADAPPFEFLYDPDLMPVSCAMDAILIDSAAPEEGEPCDQRLVRESYSRVNQLREQNLCAGQQLTPPDLSELDSLGDSATEQVLTPNVTHQGAHFSLTLSGSLSHTAFKDCRFSDCHFSGGVWHQLQFERCRFENCSWKDFALTDSTLNQCSFTQCTTTSMTVDRITARDTQFRQCNFDAWHSSTSQWHNLLMQQCHWPAASFDGEIFSGWTLDDCTLSDAVIKQGSAERVLFRKADLNGLSAYHWVLSKASLVKTDLSGSHFSHCDIDSMTCAQECNLSATAMSECLLKKVGLANGDLHGMTFNACALEECSADGANMRGTHFTRCDLAGFRLQQADLQESHWHQTSLQQACLYNASVGNAAFMDCNLTGANLANTHNNSLACFDNCLLSAVCWLPRREQTIPEVNK